MSKLDPASTTSPSKAGSKDPSTSPTEAKPIPQTEAAGTKADAKEGGEDDGMVAVPVQWSGAGKAVFLAGDFADDWKAKIAMTKVYVYLYLRDPRL
jgi:5'-AMP-activated protein kinase regulatory beta subunit